MAVPDGGPAFARAAFAPQNVGYEDVGIHDSQEGMSIRDWFAGLALQGMLADGAVPLRYSEGWEKAFGTAADAAYAFADAMLARRLR